MRKQIAAANWKMNLTLQQAKELTEQILEADINPGHDQEVVFYKGKQIPGKTGR